MSFSFSKLLLTNTKVSSFLLLHQPNLNQTLVKKFAGGNIVVGFGVVFINTFLQTVQAHIATWVHKKWDRVARLAPFFFRRVDHTVNSRAQFVVGVAF